MTSYMGVFLAAAALAIVPASCSRDEDMGYDGPVAAQVSAGIFTRAYDGQWAGGDQIGISSTGGNTVYSNIRYETVNGDGTFTPLNSRGIFFEDAEEVTFNAYYPFSGRSGESAGKVSGNTEAQSYLTDYLYATGEKGSKSDPVISFTGIAAFRHAMTRLVLNISVDLNSGFGSASEVRSGQFYLNGLRHNGTFDTVTGEAEAIGEVKQDDWQISGPVAYDIMTCKLILYPQYVEKLTFKAVIGSQTYTCDISPALEPYTSYTYNINIKKTNLDVSSGNIGNWDDGEVENGGSVEATEPEP